MKICSLDDLGKIRNDQSSLNLRMNGRSIEHKIEILLGLATCGISSGCSGLSNRGINGSKSY